MPKQSRVLLLEPFLDTEKDFGSREWFQWLSAARDFPCIKERLQPPGAAPAGNFHHSMSYAPQCGHSLFSLFHVATHTPETLPVVCNVDGPYVALAEVLCSPCSSQRYVYQLHFNYVCTAESLGTQPVTEANKCSWKCKGYVEVSCKNGHLTF